jgi:arsenate reductase
MNNINYLIYHNPRCSKSRESLELLKLKNQNFKIIEYLKVKIDKPVLKKTIQCLNTNFYDVIRDKEIIFKNLKINKLKLTIDEIVDLINVNPILLQRPLIK